MTNFLPINDKFVRVHNKFSKTAPYVCRYVGLYKSMPIGYLFSTWKLQLLELNYLWKNTHRSAFFKCQHSFSESINTRLKESKTEQACLRNNDTGSPPDPEVSSPYPPTLFIKIHFNIIQLTLYLSGVFFPFQVFDQNISVISHWSNSCYMPQPSQRPLFDRPNNI